MDSPRLDAELLLGRVLGYDRLKLYTDHDRPVEDSLRAGYRELVQRRARGEPVAYILGEREFYGLTFQVDSRCLIPRPETELLVDEALPLLRERPSPLVGDVGTGSGCLGITLAHEVPGLRARLVDVSSDALAVAEENRQRLVPSADVQLILGDGLGPLRDLGPFDLIVSNPPYIPRHEVEALERTVRDFEPWLALLVESDPLEWHRRILLEAPNLLAPAGTVLLELGAGSGAALLRWFDEAALPGTLRVRLDYSGHERVAIWRRLADR